MQVDKKAYDRERYLQRKRAREEKEQEEQQRLKKGENKRMLQIVVAEHGYPKHLPPKTNYRRLKMNIGWVFLQFHLRPRHRPLLRPSPPPRPHRRPSPHPRPCPQRNSASSRKKNDGSRRLRAKGVNELNNNKKRRNKKPRHGEKGSSRKKESNATKTSA